MDKSAFPIRTVATVGFVALLAVLQANLVHGLSANQSTPEPPPRPTVTPAPYLQLAPTQGVARQATSVTASGGLWVPGQVVTLFWDDASTLLGSAQVGADGRFQRQFVTPTDPVRATVGVHRVLAVQGASRAEATFELIAPTVTPTPTPTDTRTPTHTPTPVTPTSTPLPSDTPTPSPTLRPVTPIVTQTPTRWPTSRPATTPTNTRIPTQTPAPSPSATAAAPTPTDTRTPTSTFTPSPTLSPAATHTSTPTRTPTDTSTPTRTPGPGTPVSEILSTPSVTPAPAMGLPGTGSDWQNSFVTGFIAAVLLIVLLTAFLVVVLVILLIAWRILRVRQLQEQS
jgi:hypothetical protein